MRIVYLSESVRWSGGANQLLMMAGALQRRGHSVLLACQRDSDLVPRARAAGVPIELVRIRQDYDVLASWAVARLVRRFGAQVLHAQHSVAHAVGLMAAIGSRVPVFAV